MSAQILLRACQKLRILNNMQNRLKVIAVSIYQTFFITALVLAEEVKKLTNPLPTDDVPQLIGLIIKYLMGLLGSVALVMFLYGGFLWLTAAGEATKVTKGKETLIWAALGLVIIFASYSIVNFIFGALAK